MDVTYARSVRVEIRGGTLTVIEGPNERAPIQLGAAACIVGRNPGCDLVLSDRSVSATHAELLATDQGLRVRDLGSTNGTFVGDVRVVEALLTRPSTIRVGESALAYEPGRPERLALSKSDSFGPLVGAAPRMRALFERLRIIAPSDLAVLILGETGTGKELVAQAIHEASARAQGPFVVVDCSALPPSLAESTLFGHEKGAFTGASNKRLSPFVEARGGTVFLDELGELPLDLQPKLLRVLAEHRIKSVGSNAYVPLDVRIVAATRRDLLLEINKGAFRDDLFFRIAEERIELPPLRDRRSDVVPLVMRMMASFGKDDAFERVTEDSLERLTKYDWPGNVRELRNVVKRALAYDRGGPLDLAEHVSETRDGARPRPATTHLTQAGEGARPETYERSRQGHDRAYFLTLYAAARGNVSEMARLAELDRTTVRTALRKLGIDANGARVRG